MPQLNADLHGNRIFSRRRIYFLYCPDHGEFECAGLDTLCPVCEELGRETTLQEKEPEEE